jgi:hypothetical protein
VSRIEDNRGDSADPRDHNPLRADSNWALIVVNPLFVIDDAFPIELQPASQMLRGSGLRRPGMPGQVRVIALAAGISASSLKSSLNLPPSRTLLLRSLLVEGTSSFRARCGELYRECAIRPNARAGDAVFDNTNPVLFTIITKSGATSTEVDEPLRLRGTPRYGRGAKFR